jgi:hypothetical protein
MVVLGQGIVGLVKEAIVTRQTVRAVAPQQGDQVDAADNAVVLAGPVTVDEFDFGGIGLVQRGVIHDQDAGVAVNMLLGLVPERGRIGLDAVEQACGRIVGCRAGRSGWTRAASVQVKTSGEATRKLM